MGQAIEGGAFDSEAFRALQSRLGPMWPTMTVRGRPEDRTLIVVSSVSLDVPAHLHPLLPAYEERYLPYVLGLVRAPSTTVLYITSQPMLSRMVDYYVGLTPGIDAAEVRRRVVPICVGDWSPAPLTAKILDRPRLLARIRSLVPDPDRAVILPFVTTRLEGQLALELGVPAYGPHPDLTRLGTKSGSREVFAAAGVPFPRGSEGVQTLDDVVDALEELRASGAPDEVLVKLDDSVSGLGNAIVDVRGAASRAELAARVRALRPEDESLDAEAFLALLASQGGVVEERISGDGFSSPSVQLRASPLGDVEVLSTHDQVLGGPTGQVYFGCRFPADPAYRREVSRYGLAVGAELARRGVIGRFAIDFVAARGPAGWRVFAVEINLRNGGTTHPNLVLLALTEGQYDESSGVFSVDGTPKHYVATDHLEVPGLRSLTPDDVLDVIDERGLGWEHERMSGLVFHMISGVAVAGRVGVTAIADSPAAAGALYQKAESALAAAAGA